MNDVITGSDASLLAMIAQAQVDGVGREELDELLEELQDAHAKRIGLLLLEPDPADPLTDAADSIRDWATHLPELKVARG